MSTRERYYYVSRDLLEEWSEDGITVDWCNPSEKKSRKDSSIGNIYYFDYPYIPGREDVKRLEMYLKLTISALKRGNAAFLRSESTQVGRRYCSST